MKHRGWMVGIALIAALAAGLGAGYVIWGWPTNWYARDVTNLPASPENDIIRYGHSLIVEAAGPAGCCIRAALAAVHLGRLFGEMDDQLAQFRRPIERQEMASMRKRRHTGEKPRVIAYESANETPRGRPSRRENAARSRT
jgi:hypothetical protein